MKRRVVAVARVGDGRLVMVGLDPPPSRRARARGPLRSRRGRGQECGRPPFVNGRLSVVTRLAIGFSGHALPCRHLRQI